MVHLRPVDGDRYGRHNGVVPAGTWRVFGAIVGMRCWDRVVRHSLEVVGNSVGDMEVVGLEGVGLCARKGGL